MSAPLWSRLNIPYEFPRRNIVNNASMGADDYFNAAIADRNVVGGLDPVAGLDAVIGIGDIDEKTPLGNGKPGETTYILSGVFSTFITVIFSLAAFLVVSLIETDGPLTGGAIGYLVITTVFWTFALVGTIIVYSGKSRDEDGPVLAWTYGLVAMATFMLLVAIAPNGKNLGDTFYAEEISGTMLLLGWIITLVNVIPQYRR